MIRLPLLRAFGKNETHITTLSNSIKQYTPLLTNLSIQIPSYCPYHNFSSLKLNFNSVLNGYKNRKTDLLFSKDSNIFIKQNFSISKKFFSSATQNVITVPVPSMGDSISEGTINHWKIKVGDYVNADDVIAVIDTDKVSIDINSPYSGLVTGIFSSADDTVLVGADFFSIDTNAEKIIVEDTSKNEKLPEIKPQENTEKPPASKNVSPSSSINEGNQKISPSKSEVSSVDSKIFSAIREDSRVQMSRMRQRIGERLKAGQNTAVMLTTFNECDMSAIMSLRSEMKESFQESHGVKMGFVSAFMLASSLSLKKFPIVNAQIDGKSIVYKNYVDIGVAVATPTGLMVPIVNDCQTKTWADLEKNLDDLAKRARKNQIAIEELSGGSFTISNGGVYGSMMSTPLLNPPQTSILGLHSIKKRAVVHNNDIVIRPMMYLALTYDHRLIDGREAVLFLNSIKDYIENPSLMLLGI